MHLTPSLVAYRPLSAPEADPCRKLDQKTHLAAGFGPWGDGHGWVDQFVIAALVSWTVDDLIRLA